MYIPLTFEGALQSCLYAKGGYEQGFFISGSDQYAFHLFQTGSGQQFQVLAGTLNNVQIAVVGGGGGGACALLNGAGGGGGGVIISPNNTLYAGTYTINVGSGGDGATYSASFDTPGFTGNPSSIIGNNLYLSVDGGKGGIGNVGGDSGAPTAFSGSTGTATRGGGGGGSRTAAPAVVFPDYGTYGAGITASFVGSDREFAAGGIGAAAGTDEANSQFGRGGAGVNRNAGVPGEDGNDGCIVIQYKINDYCRNWFNETGSCNCSQVTFNIQEATADPDANLTGSYVYTQCGTNTFLSGSLRDKWPVNVCAASGSWYQQTNSILGGGQIVRVGFASGNNCFSASYGVQTCVTQSFTPTNCGNLLFYSASTAALVYYVPTGSANINISYPSASYVGYICASSGSTDVGFYPTGILGTGNVITSSIVGICRNYLFTPGGGVPRTATYYSCDTNVLQSSVISTPTTFCIRVGRPTSLTGVGSTITDTSASCFPGGTGSCGCP